MDIYNFNNFNNLNNVSSMLEDLKMVFLIRKDLNMSAGKVSEQVSHATVGLIMDIIEHSKLPNQNNTNFNNNNRINELNLDLSLILKLWRRKGEKKIALKVDNEEQMYVHSHYLLFSIYFLFFIFVCFLFLFILFV